MSASALRDLAKNLAKIDNMNFVAKNAFSQQRGGNAGWRLPPYVDLEVDPKIVGGGCREDKIPHKRRYL